MSAARQSIHSKPSRTVRSNSALTQKQILDAAEELFSQLGYSGTAMRAISELAGVNLAAANYHFGSKQELFVATMARRAAPINEERIKRLDSLEARTETANVEEIIHAFLDPLEFDTATNMLPRLIARVFVEPQALSRTLLLKVFEPTMKRFIHALGLALPDVPTPDIQWRFHFMIGAMVHFLNFEVPLASEQTDTNGLAANLAQGKEQLIKFVVAGVAQ